MTTNKNIEAISNGPIFPITLKLAIPILIGYLFSFGYILVDTFYLSLIDKTSTAIISGTGIVFPIMILFQAIGSGLSIGMSSMIARAIGEKKREVIDNAIPSGILISLILGIATLIIGYVFRVQIIDFLTGTALSAEAKAYGMDYYIFILPGIVLLLTGRILLGILSGEGLTNHIAVSFIISTIANLILDPIFIFVLKMGTAGAALATTVSISISAIYVILIFLLKKSMVRFDLNFFKAKISILIETFKIGIPQSLGTLTSAIVSMYLNNLFSSIGQAEMNAWTLCGKIDQFVILPAAAIAGASLTMIGQNFGNKNINRLYSIYWKHTKYAYVTVLVLSVIYMIGAPFIFQSFSNVKEVVELSTLEARIISLFNLGTATFLISLSVFQGIGKSMPTFVLNILRLVIFLVPFAYLAAYVFNLGFVGIVISSAIGNVFILPICIIWILRTLKKIKAKINSEEEIDPEKRIVKN